MNEARHMTPEEAKEKLHQAARAYVNALWKVHVGNVGWEKNQQTSLSKLQQLALAAMEFEVAEFRAEHPPEDDL